jgi:protein involved in polysaccharide export with SLBB domain
LQAAPAPPPESVPAETERPNPASARVPSAAAGRPFGVGDRLKIAFYEQLNVEEDKWGRASSVLWGIQQRPELSGEFTVQEDGTVSLPLLGTIPVADRTAPEVQTALSEAFEKLLDRKALVNILSLERAPLYVLGPVKNPGSYKYAPGMTVLHAIALAGGLDRPATDPRQKIEAVRAIQKRSGAVDAMLKLVARAAVLKAERDGTTPRVPLKLLELVGATEARNLIIEQSDRRKAVGLARKNQERTVLNALELAQQDAQLMYGRMAPLDELIRLRQERVNSMKGLVDRKVLGNAVLNQVLSELSEAEQRRQDAINQYAMVKQRLAGLALEAVKMQSDLRNDLEVAIDTVERQIADNEREFNTSEGILSNLPATRAQFVPANENKVTYEIVRHTAAGLIGIASNGMTVLQPGDLVRITTGSSASETPDRPVPTSTEAERLPAGRAETVQGWRQPLATATSADGHGLIKAHPDSD